MTLFYDEEGDLVFPQLARVLLPSVSTSELLELLVELAVSAVEGVSGASVSAVHDGGQRLETTNASSAAIRSMDESQYASGEGQCVHAIRTGVPVAVELPSDRWAYFSRAALAGGIQFVHSLPITAQGTTLGALNLYSDRPTGFGADGVRVANGLVAQSSVVLANSFALTVAELTVRQLREALESRDLIGQAKGVIMGRQNVPADRAFDILRRASQRTNRKLRDVAAEVLQGIGDPEAGH